jgi:hypothetical protein
MCVEKHFRALRVYREAVNMMANANPWCISSSQVRENGAEYDATEGRTYPRTPTPTNIGTNHPPALTT